MVRDKILKHVLSVKYFMTCKVGLVSHFNFSCVQLVTSLEDQILRSERGGGSICILFVGSLMKIFQLVPVRKSSHEPTSLCSDLV